MTHDFDGKKYEKASDHQKEWGAKLIAELNLRGTERIVDLGCGDGAITYQIAQLIPNGGVVGIDASLGMIDAARYRKRGNLEFIKMDINDIDFIEQFDVAFSNATLHWVKDHKRMLENVRKALRPGGYLRFNFAGDGNCSYFFKVIKAAMALDQFAPYFAGFEWPWYMPPIEEYWHLVGSSGLEDARVWGENADRYFPDKEAMVRWIDQPSIVPFLSRVSDRDKAAFREFVVGRMIEETKQADGRCFETFRRINVFARK